MPRHRTAGSLLLLSALSLCAGCGQAQPSASPPPSTPPNPAIGISSWTKFGGSLDNNAVLEQGANRTFRADWHRTTSEGLLNMSLVHGVLYVGGLGPHYHVYAVNAQTGRQIWATKLNNQIKTTPVYGNGMVFVGTGNRNWVNPGPTYNFRATHLVRGTGKNSLVALSAKTGTVLWQIATRGENMPTPIYSNGMLYAVGGAGTVRGIDAKTGRVVWRYQLPSYVSMASPTYVNHLLIFGAAHPYAVYAIDTRTHRPAWVHALPQVIGGVDDCAPAVSGNTVVTEGSVTPFRHPTEEILALSVQTGQVLWSHKVGSGPIPTYMQTSPPVIHGGVVYISSPITGETYAFNLQTGAPLWHTRTRAVVKSAPVVYHGMLYLQDVKGTLYRIQASDGRILKTLPLGGKVTSNYPILVGSTLFLANRAGSLTALPLGRIGG